MTKKTDNFEEKSKAAFKQQQESLDSQTLQRLRSARENALSKQEKSSWLTSINLKWLTGAGAGLALASLLTFMIAPGLMSSNNLSPLDDLEMLSAEADLDLVTDMDFYQWLDESALSENTL